VYFVIKFARVHISCIQNITHQRDNKFEKMTLSKLLVCGIMIISCLAVVDRTYYIYLGLDISATHD